MPNFTFQNLEHVGRLGNQLFQVAWVYTQALFDGTHGFIKPDWQYRNIFSLPEEMYLPPFGDIVDGGTEYFQDIGWWHGFDDEIRNIFRLSGHAETMLFEYEDGRFDVANHICAVHFRRGDYVDNPRHFPLPTDRYYIEAMNNLVEEEYDVLFYIFSDSIEVVRQQLFANSRFNHLRERMLFFHGTVTPVEIADRPKQPLDWLDMACISKCDSHIIANSTFSWWGAFLSDNKNVIYPSRWFGTHPDVKDISWRNMIPSTWVEELC